MSKVVLVVISVMGLSMIYLGIAATLCVVRDQSLARSSAVLRILVSWFVPLLGPRLARYQEKEPFARQTCQRVHATFGEAKPGTGYEVADDTRC
jgi:hypothetical protein